MTLADLNALSAHLVSWVLTYGIHSTLLLGAAIAVAARFPDEHRWLDLVWKTALVGPLVTATLQVGAEMRPLGGQWTIAVIRPAVVGATPRPAEPVEQLKPAELSLGLADRTREPRRASPSPPEAPAQPSPQAVARIAPDEPVAPSVGTQPRALAAWWPLVAVVAWIALGALGLVRFAARFLRLHRALRSGVSVMAPGLHEMVDEMRETAGEASPIRLATSGTCAVPLALVGRWIVLPERFAQNLDAGQQQAAIAHEVAHVVRRDPVWRLVAGVLERGLFFQPLNRAARVGLCESAEFLCDQWAVRHTRSPLALARCLAAVAAWTSPDSDAMLAAASPMAQSDSPLVRRVARILADPPTVARRPRLVWLMLSLLVVVAAAPLVTATQLPDPAVASYLSVGAVATAPTDSKDPEHVNVPSAPATWTAGDLAQVRAQIRVLRPPTPADPLNLRWRWALAEAGRQGIGDFWIAYAFKTPTHANDFMMSDSRDGSFVNSGRHGRFSGPSLAALLEDPGALGEPGSVITLLHYNSAHEGSIDRAGYQSAGVGWFDLGKSPVFWLGPASEVESFKRVGDLFGQTRLEKVQTLLIELASLHPTTDLVLPFLSALLDPSRPVAIRREAAEGFDHHHDPRSVEILLRVARTDQSSEVRAEAAETIGEVQTPQSVPALTELATRSTDPAVRREAAEAFADQPPELAIPAIERLIASSVDDDTLAEAIEALGEIHDDRALPLLVRTATTHSSQRAQQEAVETLGDIDNPAALAALVRVVWEHKDVTVQREAVETIGDRRPVAIAELERILRDHPSEDVQAEAIETLADASDDGLNRQILALVSSGHSGRLRREALESIADAASRWTDAASLDKIEQAIEGAIFNDPDRSVQEQALDVVEELPRERALRVLEHVVARHPDADLREDAREHQRELRGEGDDDTR